MAKKFRIMNSQIWCCHFETSKDPIPKLISLKAAGPDLGRSSKQVSSSDPADFEIGVRQRSIFHHHDDVDAIQDVNGGHHQMGCGHRVVNSVVKAANLERKETVGLVIM